MTLVDQPAVVDALIGRDAALPALALVLRPDELAERLGCSVVVRRLRYKPGTSVHAAITVGPADEWFLLAGYGPDGAAKLDKDRAAAHRRGLPVLADTGRSLVVPAATDRALPRRAIETVRPSGTLAYNPRRRLVLTDLSADGASVAKVYAAGQTPPDGRFAAAIHAAGVRTPAALPSPHRSVRYARWCPGRRSDPARDAAAVDGALHALARVRPATPLAMSPRCSLRRRIDAALRLVTAVLPEQRGPAGMLRAHFPWATAALDTRADVVVHGDLSPDQVVVDDAGAAWLLDLDDCGHGPSRWDQASWFAAQIAAGSRKPTPLAGPPPDAVVAAAALLLRAPEPFARQRPAWPATTARMLDATVELLDAGGTTW